MSVLRARYNLDSVKEDIKSFFGDSAHRAFSYGSRATSCDNNSLFYKKQIQVIFENYYPHDVAGKAVNALIADGFLKEELRKIGIKKAITIIFVFNKSRRYVSTEIKERSNIVERFSDDEMNDGCGKYAESLFNHMFEKNGFTISARNANSFAGKRWRKSRKDLDFIIEKDGIGYGVEVKNTFDYIPQYEFEEKIEICNYLGLLPLFPVRFASPQQYQMMKKSNGITLSFKTRIFPPGNRKLVTDIWNHFRLPVNIWYDILQPIENGFLNFHNRNKVNRTLGN